MGRSRAPRYEDNVYNELERKSAKQNGVERNNEQGKNAQQSLIENIIQENAG